ncbi:MAG: glycosyltransferase family 2 protein [Burkholderiaceae bacterium]|nr:glycosyltransferase family 2 protein [Burkholderiaceae bacterium]
MNAPNSDKGHVALVERGSGRIQVDVVLCTFNGARFLAAQLESIERQARQPDRVRVFDDGSTDGTLAILARFKSRLLLDVSVNASRLGASQNFSRALARADADVVFLCDQDDVWRPDKVACQLALLDGGPRGLLACSDARLIDAEGALLAGSLLARLGASAAARWDSGALQAALLKRNLITGATCAVRRDLLSLALPVPAGVWHDEWLALVAASCDGIVWADHPLIDYRLHGGNAAGIDQVGTAATFAALGSDARAFQRAKAVKLAQLAGVLRSSSGRVVPDRLAMVEAAAEHWRTRAGRPAWGQGRLRAVIAELRAGRYARFGAGWRSALNDLR